MGLWHGRYLWHRTKNVKVLISLPRARIVAVGGEEGIGPNPQTPSSTAVAFHAAVKCASNACLIGADKFM